MTVPGGSRVIFIQFDTSQYLWETNTTIVEEDVIKIHDFSFAKLLSYNNWITSRQSQQTKTIQWLNELSKQTQLTKIRLDQVMAGFRFSFD